MNKNLFIEVYNDVEEFGKSYKQNCDSIFSPKIEIDNIKSNVIAEIEFYTHPALVGSLCHNKVYEIVSYATSSNLIMLLKEVISKTKSYKLRAVVTSFFNKSNNSLFISAICSKKGFGGMLLKYFIDFAHQKRIKYIELSSTFENITFYPLFGFEHKTSCNADEPSVTMSNKLKQWLKNNKPLTTEKLFREKLYRDYIQSIRNTMPNTPCKNKTMIEFLNSQFCYDQTYKMKKCFDENYSDVEQTTIEQQNEMEQLKLNSYKLNYPIQKFLNHNKLHRPNDESMKLQQEELNLTETTSKDEIKKQHEIESLEVQPPIITEKDLTQDEVQLLNSSYSSQPYCSIKFFKMIDEQIDDIQLEKSKRQKLVEEYKQNPTKELQEKILQIVKSNDSLMKQEIINETKNKINTDKLLNAIITIHDNEINTLSSLLNNCFQHSDVNIIPIQKFSNMYNKVIDRLMELSKYSQTSISKSIAQKWIDSHSTNNMKKIAKKMINNTSFISFSSINSYLKNVSATIIQMSKNFDKVILCLDYEPKLQTSWMAMILYKYIQSVVTLCTKSYHDYQSYLNKNYSQKILYIESYDIFEKQIYVPSPIFDEFGESKLLVVCPYVLDNIDIPKKENKYILFSPYTICKQTKLVLDNHPHSYYINNKNLVCCEYKYLQNSFNEMYFFGVNLDFVKTNYILCNNKIITELNNIQF
jgi:GNAT superfamily N-acetyltransferase